MLVFLAFCSLLLFFQVVSGAQPCWTYRVTPGAGCNNGEQTHCGLKCLNPPGSLTPHSHTSMNCGADIFTYAGFDIDITENCGSYAQVEELLRKMEEIQQALDSTEWAKNFPVGKQDLTCTNERNKEEPIKGPKGKNENSGGITSKNLR